MFDVYGRRVYGDLALHVVERGVLEDEHWVGIVQRWLQHPSEVVRRGRGQDPDAWDVRVPALQAVRMLGRDLPARTGGHADHERHVELPARHVEDRRRVVHDLIEREQAEVHGHDLHDGPQARHGRADAGADEGGLGQRRVPDALGPELLEESEAYRETPPVPTDFRP